VSRTCRMHAEKPPKPAVPPAVPLPRAHSAPFRRAELCAMESVASSPAYLLLALTSVFHPLLDPFTPRRPSLNVEMLLSLTLLLLLALSLRASRHSALVRCRQGPVVNLNIPYYYCRPVQISLAHARIHADTGARAHPHLNTPHLHTHPPVQNSPRPVLGAFTDFGCFCLGELAQF